MIVKARELSWVEVWSYYNGIYTCKGKIIPRMSFVMRLRNHEPTLDLNKISFYLHGDIYLKKCQRNNNV